MMELFHNSKNIALLENGVLNIIDLDFCSGIFTDQYLIAYFDFHFDFSALVVITARTYRDNFSNLRLFLSASGKNLFPLKVLFS